VRFSRLDDHYIARLKSDGLSFYPDTSHSPSYHVYLGDVSVEVGFIHADISIAYRNV
jgi:hypothetical protein